MTTITKINTLTGEKTQVEMTPEQQAQYDADRQIKEDQKLKRVSELARKSELKASSYVQDWDTRIRGKTFLEIKTLYDGATQQQKSDLLFYLLLVRALEVKG